MCEEETSFEQIGMKIIAILCALVQNLAAFINKLNLPCPIYYNIKMSQNQIW